MDGASRRSEIGKSEYVIAISVRLSPLEVENVHAAGLVSKKQENMNNEGVDE